MKNIPDIFGSMVFNDSVMQQRLPRDMYKALIKTMSQGIHLEIDIANVVASVMKDWAVEKGATHFTHWFQPMTGITAEKHESFISPVPGGKVIMEFSGSALVRGEPDASSFPSGGLRATFEARGYTVWDTTSYAFIKNSTLYIPTAFCSYGGEALDKKTPLLRSMEAINKQALRILKLFGNPGVQRVNTTVGAEQEYFLIGRDMYKKRPDLIYTGRTLFGAPPPKGQEMEDHYFGSLRPRVAAFMKEFEEELWKLGVYAKIKHNEAAPAQHEFAPVYITTNIATDHNQLVMEQLKAIAEKHNLACLLHEKPFAGVNGSGKHINWSLATDKGQNLLEPSQTPYENAQFLLFLAAVIKAVDEYQDLLRVSAASAGNDHRLGQNEAPPAIVSMFLGEELTAILEAIESNASYKDTVQSQMEVGATVLPHFPKDTTDRNRTSPIAFTGNKFEFRMLGSAFSIADSNTVLNTAVAESLKQFADVLESSEIFLPSLAALVKETFTKHKRVIFNGNNYSQEWVAEAESRGLSNQRTTVDALPQLVSAKNIELFAAHGVLTETEIQSRYEILLEDYCKTINIEALTMLDMVNRQIIPACIDYQNILAKLVKAKKYIDGPYDASLETRLLNKISSLSSSLLQKLDSLESARLESQKERDHYAHAKLCRRRVYTSMEELRIIIDQLETVVSKKYWPLPSYGELLYDL
ncbi:MAG: glutamine synthetase III [Defluviitaleaceae bacterium]|nr:glutamine synthetase III [Defluviitaleaceae bacterium]